MTLGKQLFMFIVRSSRGQNSLSLYSSYMHKMVLKGSFVRNTREDSALHIHCPAFPGDRALRMGVLALQGLILDNFHHERMWWS